MSMQRTRLIIIFWLSLACYLVVWGRLFVLQIFYQEFFLLLADRQHVIKMYKAVDRAPIVDCKGIFLADTITHTTACISPKLLKNRHEVAAFLQERFPRAAERLAAEPQALFMYVQRKLSEADKQAIKERGLTDIFFIGEAGRRYMTPSLGPVIGMTSIDNEGSFGLEYAYNDLLRGKPATILLKRDARSKKPLHFEREVIQEGVAGIPLHTTLDSTLHFLVHEELRSWCEKLQASEGAVLIMNPETGSILVMANYPTFDPSASSTLDLALTKNRIVSETYEFGSVMKACLTLAGCAEGIIDKETVINCYNVKSMTLHGMKLNTVQAGGLLSFKEVIATSNNIGTAQIACKLGDTLYEHYRRCGFGRSTGTCLGEQAGHVTHPSTWSKQSLASLSYGYEIRATLLQVGCFWCMLARNGQQVIPSLILSPAREQANVPLQLYNETVIEAVREILTYAVMEGTAKRAQVRGCQVFGKTGSAKLLIDGAYHPTRSLYTFAGCLRKGSYQRVIVLYIKEPVGSALYGSTVAAPLFKAIAERMLIYDGQL